MPLEGRKQTKLEPSACLRLEREHARLSRGSEFRAMQPQHIADPEAAARNHAEHCPHCRLKSVGTIDLVDQSEHLFARDRCLCLHASRLRQLDLAKLLFEFSVGKESRPLSPGSADSMARLRSESSIPESSRKIAG